MRVLIAVTHLLGAGHLTRAAALARAFAQARHETTLVSGGMPADLSGLDGIAVVQLPPVRIEGTDFRTLLDEAGHPIEDTRRARRKELLLQALKAAKPHVVVTELFPFGRRVLADEFGALAQEARGLDPRPVLLCSIRDILVAPSKPERVEAAHERILRDYDAVLVHGDPRLVPLEASWPVDERLRSRIRYTGYVDENPNPVPGGPRNGIVVSGGSSAASLPLYRTAVLAARHMADRPWRILVGRGIAEADFQRLQTSVPAHAVVERARPDFRGLLARAELSVSQAGYNTVVDLLRSGVQAVLVPFEAGRETEQRLRAERLKALGLADIVLEDELTPERLADAIRQGLAHPASPPPPLSLDGAPNSVDAAESLALSSPALHRTVDWSPLDEALERAGDAGCPIRFWWRDDDAVADTPQLGRLLDLARRAEAGIALAVIPQGLHASLPACLSGEDRTFALVHGWSHANHAPVGEKKAEFGAHRAAEIMGQEAEQALRIARAGFGEKLLPVFVPPWNRIDPDWVPFLPRLGYRALSTFRDRSAAHPAQGLLQVNAHIDPIDWRGRRSALDPAPIAAALAEAVEKRLTGRADGSEPIGLLTHHLVHDEAIWSLCERLIQHLALRGCPFLRIDELFGNGSRIAGET